MALKETKRYVATVSFYVWAENDSEALSESRKIAKMIDLEHDNCCDLEELHENNFGSLDSRKVEIKQKEDTYSQLNELMAAKDLMFDALKEMR